MSRRRTIVVFGIVGRSPVAGVAWQALHYLVGLRRLGHDVWYVEDTGVWPYDAARQTVTDDANWTLGYIERVMSWAGLAGRWAYVSAVDGSTSGISEVELSALLARADAALNLTGSTMLREPHLAIPARIYLETDPGLPQIEAAKQDPQTLEVLAAHTHLFTFGENIGADDCGLPTSQFSYLPTRQPIVTEWWRQPTGRASPPRRTYTTIASWFQSGKDIDWNGVVYRWSKHLEFLRFIDLPRRASAHFELALAAADEDSRSLLRKHGWRLRDADAVSREHLGYRTYIASSRGEFTVAKDQYIRLRSGWFSDRSACYLAAGRPVITQETGFSKFLPTGRGLFAFTTMDEVLAAIEAIEADYEGNVAAAREVADTHFAAERVLGSLLDRAGL